MLMVVPKVSAAVRLSATATVAFLVGAWPARVEGGYPSYPMRETHLCEVAARPASTHCEFPLGTARVLRVPWEIFPGEPVLRHAGSGSSMDGLAYANPYWPLAKRSLPYECLPASGRSGRGDRLPSGWPCAYDVWQLRGAILADGQIMPRTGKLPGDATAFNLRASTKDGDFGHLRSLDHYLSLHWRREDTTTSAEGGGAARTTVILVRGRTPERITMEVVHRIGEQVLARVCGGAGHDAQLCSN